MPKKIVTVERVLLALILGSLVLTAVCTATSDPAPRPAPTAELRALLAVYNTRAAGVQDYVERLYGLYQGLKVRVLRLETGYDWLLRELGRTPPPTWWLDSKRGFGK